MEKKPTSAPLMGLMLGLVLIVTGLITFFAELYTEQWAQWIGFIILFGGIVACVLMHAKEVGYREGFGALFGFGFKVTAAATVIMILYVVLQGFLFPDIKTRIIEMTQEQMSKNPQANQAQIDQTVSWMSNNFTLMIILGVLFWYLVLGAAASLLGAAVAKKRPVAHTFDNI